jgi:type IV pilus assembly protein PilQ
MRATHRRILSSLLLFSVLAAKTAAAPDSAADNATSGFDDDYIFSDESAKISPSPPPPPPRDVAAPLPEASPAPQEKSSSVAPEVSVGTVNNLAVIRGAKQKSRVINVDFKDAKFKDVMKVISQESNNNYVFPPAIGELKVNITLHRVPWDEALAAILYSLGLGVKELPGGIYRVDELSVIGAETIKKEENAKKEALVIPTQVYVYQLSYSQATDVVAIVKTMLPSSEQDKRVKVQADTRTNSIIIEAIPVDLRKIKTLISRIDLQTPQVKIKTRIIEILRGNSKFLGINWAAPYRNDQSAGGGFGSLVFPNNMKSAFSVDTGIAPAALDNRGAFDFHFGSINNAFELDLRLRMSEVQSTTKTLQNNTFMVLNNQPAVIEAGSEEFFSVPQGNGRSEMTSVKYTLRIEITPHITTDGSVKMDINVASSSPIPAEAKSAVANKNLRNLSTFLIRKNNETAVIGGLNSSDIGVNETGIPYLSKIPIIGALFKSKRNTENKRELIILVTPTIISNDKDLSLDSFREEMKADMEEGKLEQEKIEKKS